MGDSSDLGIRLVFMRLSRPPSMKVLSTQGLCFVRKVCRFAMKGLPLGLQETTSGFREPSTGLDERTI
jgi:hypothetical protein